MSEQQPNSEKVEIFTDDGYRLVGELYEPAEAPRAFVIINCATGAPASYYKSFAGWACEAENVCVLIYDYRDFGQSAVNHVKASAATMSDWGVKDQSAALKFALERSPDLPVWVIGHSLGGLCLNFYEQSEQVERLIAVASGPAYIFRHPIAFVPLAISFWWIIGPLATMFSGYLPGRQIGFGADIPKGVYWQWRRWCTSSAFYEGDWGLKMPEPDLGRFKGKLTIIGFEDDTSIPPPVSADLARYYPGARSSEKYIFDPKELGLRSVGHLGAFHERNKTLWPHLLKG